MNEAVACELFLYVDDSCLVYRLKNVKEIEQNLKFFLMFFIGLLIIGGTFILEVKKQKAYCYAQNIK